MCVCQLIKINAQFNTNIYFINIYIKSNNLPPQKNLKTIVSLLNIITENNIIKIHKYNCVKKKRYTNIHNKFKYIPNKSILISLDLYFDILFQACPMTLNKYKPFLTIV